jgi:hypothetical protein
MGTAQLGLMFGQGQGSLGRDRSIVGYEIFFLHSNLPSEMSKLEIRFYCQSVVLNETKLQAFRTSVTFWRWKILMPGKAAAVFDTAGVA